MKNPSIKRRKFLDVVAKGALGGTVAGVISACTQAAEPLLKSSSASRAFRSSPDCVTLARHQMLAGVHADRRGNLFPIPKNSRRGCAAARRG